MENKDFKELNFSDLEDDKTNERYMYQSSYNIRTNKRHTKNPITGKIAIYIII